jgi:hypothetical protein
MEVQISVKTLTPGMAPKAYKGRVEVTTMPEEKSKIAAIGPVNAKSIGSDIVVYFKNRIELFNAMNALARAGFDAARQRVTFTGAGDPVVVRSLLIANHVAQRSAMPPVSIGAKSGPATVE